MTIAERLCGASASAAKAAAAATRHQVQWGLFVDASIGLPLAVFLLSVKQENGCGPPRVTTRGVDAFYDAPEREMATSDMICMMCRSAAPYHGVAAHGASRACTHSAEILHHLKSS